MPCSKTFALKPGSPTPSMWRGSAPHCPSAALKSHFRVHEALFSGAATNIMWELKPSVRLAQGSVQWETGGLEERRQHLHDRRGQVSRAEDAKSQRGEASPGLQKLQRGCSWSGCPDTRQGALADFWQDSPGTGTSAQFQNWTTWSVRPSVSSRKHHGSPSLPQARHLEQH